MPGPLLISVPAGVAKMPAPVFLLYTVAGTVLWTAALTVAGYLLADAYKKIRDVVDSAPSSSAPSSCYCRPLRASAAQGCLRDAHCP